MIIQQSRRQRCRTAGRRILPALGLLAVCWCGTGCTADYYQRSADKEATGILGWKSQRVNNVDSDDLSVVPAEPISLEDLAENAQAAEFLGKSAQSEVGGRIIKLEDALDLAINYNRTYLSQKELIYLQTLELTLVRHELAPIFTGTGGIARSSNRSESSGGGSDSAGDGATRSAAVETNVDRLIAENTFASRSNLGFSMLQRTGARLAADFTTDFLQFLGGGRSANGSALVVTVAQPLLRGAGYKATMENLTQAERELLYSIREFATFRREFIVDIADRYYNVLLARDQARNNWVGYEGFRLSVEREEALANENRRTQTELGQLRQAALSAERDWVNAISDYQRQVDELKIELGISVDTPIVLDESELSELKIVDPKVTQEQAQEVALVTRPEIESANDRVEDAVRRIEVAQIDLRPGLDIVGSYDLSSPTTDGTPKLDLSRRNWSAGLDVDLPFDRKEQRNNYRSTLLNKEQRQRDRDLAYDQVRLQVNNDWRALGQAKRNYEISQSGAELAGRRLREQEILAEIGQSEARDLVDARRDLVNSRNAISSAMVDHTLARLRLWQDMGILYIKDDGSWLRVLEAEADRDE